MNEQELIQAEEELQKLYVKYHTNFKYITHQATLQERNALYKKYSPENDGHLAKILANRGIVLG